MDDKTSFEMQDDPLKRKFWAPISNVIDFCTEYITQHQCTKILEVGPGPRPFKHATHFIDHEARFIRENTTNIDVEFDAFPFPDKYFDFVYCRHVLEDLDNPFLCISEMQRVGKSGYIETPNPIAEISRFVIDPYRGYPHHRWFVAADFDKLYFLAKYPLFEYGTNETINTIFYDLLKNPFYWNTYYFWENQIQFRKYKSMVDFIFKSGDLSTRLSEMLDFGHDNVINFGAKILKIDVKHMAAT